MMKNLTVFFLLDNLRKCKKTRRKEGGRKLGLNLLEKENADLKRQLEERRNLAKKRFYADLLIYCLLEINLFAIMTQQWDVKLLYFFLAEVVGLLVWTGWAFFWESRKS